MRDNSPNDFAKACELDEAVRANDGRGDVYLYEGRVPLAMADLDTPDREEPNLFTACESKVTSGGDPALQKQIQTLQDCFPDLFPKAKGLLDLAETWRLNTSGPIADPAGLTHSGTGPINVGFTSGSFAISMTIRFYDPNGNEQTGLPLTATDLAARIDEAATSLRNSFPGGTPFLVGTCAASTSAASFMSPIAPAGRASLNAAVM